MSVYSDLNSIEPTVKSKLKDVEAVYQSLYNIFSVRLGERLFLPDFGFSLEDELFELMDDTSTLAIFSKVVEAVDRWESRVLVDQQNTKITPYPDLNMFEVLLVFAIRGVDGSKFEFRGSVSRAA